ncbi:MAG: hypothetical protein MUE67_06175 [Anaerolineales bacterium]|jgi:hypothetical protein|nr:hypothetical protein [Anaerolineales bacterium]
MPTYHYRIYICPAEHGQPGWIMDFPFWWDRMALFQKYGGRQFDTGNPFYVDYALLLTMGEAAVLDDQGRKAYERDPRSQTPTVIEAMNVVEKRLKSSSWVIVEAYEWESGFE